MRFYVYILPVLYLSTNDKTVIASESSQPVAGRPEYGKCSTPESKAGMCVNIKSCASLYHLLMTDGRNPTTASFLRKSQCGNTFENGMPVVCCPDVTSSTSTPKPTTTTPLTRPISTKPTKPRTTTPKPTINYGECGKSERQDTRIVGGRNATIGAWPWMVALGYQSSSNSNSDLDFKCGATLISNKWVVTAAHCVVNVGNSKLTTARLGDLNLDDNVKDGATPVDVPIDEIIPHPEYNTKPITNDIALLRLRNKIKFNRDIRPACLLSGSLYRTDTYYTNKKPYIIGWGALEWRGPTSSLLQETDITVLNLTDCAKIYASQPTAKIDSRVLCAGEKGRDTCQGDSGGPLLFPLVDKNQPSDTYYLGGVVSFGVRCADLTYPGRGGSTPYIEPFLEWGRWDTVELHSPLCEDFEKSQEVYTRIAAFTDWISETTGLNVDE